MSLILSLETSTTVCSAALHLNGNLLSQFELHEEQSHAGKLALLIENLLNVTGRSVADLNAVAVSSGPGSYTGLRIGTSTAKGICYAVNIPLLACSSLEVLTEGLAKSSYRDALFCPMLDARRMEVYTMVTNASGQILLPVSAMVVDENSFQDLLSLHTIIFFGDGSEKCRALIQHPNAIFVGDQYPRASALGGLAARKLDGGQTEDLGSFEPFYLKEFLIKKS